MTNGPPLTLVQLRQVLHVEFDGKIAGKGKTGIESERNFLSKALAAYALCKLSKCDSAEAASAIVDGGGDGGIDALHFSLSNNTLWVVQSKYFESGDGEPELGDVSKFRDGVENLLSAKFDFFSRNEGITKKLPLIKKWLDSGTLQVRTLLVYSSLRASSPDRERTFQPTIQRFCAGEPDYLKFSTYNLTTIGDWLIGADESEGVPYVEITLLNPGWIKKPYETLYGQVRIGDLVELIRTHGERLVDANIRKYKGSTSVNDRILQTLQDKPANFFYLNNGLTAFCRRIEIPAADRAATDAKRVRAYGLSIVNGAQTLGSIGAFDTGNIPLHPDAYAFVKVISLERCEDDVAFAQQITQCTNFQNHIDDRNFVALDDDQQRLAGQLSISGIEYHFKDGDDEIVDAASEFTLDEAARALACLADDGDCDLCATALRGSKQLLQRANVYEDEPSTRYGRVFNFDNTRLDPRIIWRSVQTMRHVAALMSAEARASTGQRKEFYKYARWLVLKIVFVQVKPHLGESLLLSTDDLNHISRITNLVAETIWTVTESLGYFSTRSTEGGQALLDLPKSFQSIFGNAVDCKRIKRSTFARLAKNNEVGDL